MRGGWIASLLLAMLSGAVAAFMLLAIASVSSWP